MRLCLLFSNRFLLFVLKLVFAFLPVSSVIAGYEIIPDDDICIHFSKFGLKDLDQVNEELANEEKEISENLISKGREKTNNVVVAALTFYFKDTKGKETVERIPIGLPSDDNHTKVWKVFESTLNLIPTTLEKNYSLDEELIKIPDLVKHVNSLWAKKDRKDKEWKKKEDLTPWEKDKIWENFISFQKNLISIQEEVTKETTLIALSMNSLSTHALPFNNLALTLREQEDNDCLHQGTETIRDNIFRIHTDINKEVEVLINRTNTLFNNLQAFNTSLTKSKGKITGLYNYFWHSEQRLIYFLTSKQGASFWDKIADLLINIENPLTINGVFLHIHSRLNFCQTCRRALARACSPSEGILYNMFKDKFNKWNIKNEKPFCLKILGSFRVRYKATLLNGKNKTSYWMSYNDNPHEETFTKLQPLFIRRIALGTLDELEKDKEYENALKLGSSVEEEQSKSKESSSQNKNSPVADVLSEIDTLENYEYNNLIIQIAAGISELSIRKNLLNPTGSPRGIYSIDSKRFRLQNVVGTSMRCFFNAMGLDANTEVARLKNKRNDPIVRYMIANEIVSSAENPEQLPRQVKDAINYALYQIQRENLNELEKIRSNELVAQSSSTDLQKPQDLPAEFQKIGERGDDILEELRKRAFSLKAFNAFLDYHIGSSKMMVALHDVQGEAQDNTKANYTSIDAIAYINNLGIKIYQPNGRGDLHLVHQFIPHEATEIAYLYHQMLHFQALIPEK